MTEHGLAAAVATVRAARANRPAIEVFSHYYRQASEGVTGMNPEDPMAGVGDPR